MPEPKRPKYALLDPITFYDDFGDELTFVDYPAIAKDYCIKVIAGEYPACEYVKLAARRYLTMLDMASTGKFGFTFSEAHAIDFCAFAETLPLAEDNFRGVAHAELEPFQIWIGCAIYGFRDARGFRYVNEAYIEIPRKSAKSVLATAVALYDLREPTARSPLVLIAAATLEQANRVFSPVCKVIEIDADLTDKYKLRYTNLKVECAINAGEIFKVASIGEHQDGWNPTTIILEELHAQNPDVYQVLKSAMGSRGGQLLFQITTAGRNAHGLAWDNRKNAIQVLEGHQENWKMFAAIYTVDKSDLEDEEGNRKTDHLFEDEQLWLKAAPMLGVSFDMAVLHSLALGAKQKPQDREEFLRTRLNIWTNAASKLFNIELVRRGARPEMTIDDFRGKKCWGGLDLSTSGDISSLMLAFEAPDNCIALFGWHWISADHELLTDPDYMAMIRTWVDQEKLLKSTEGRVDQADIEAKVRWVHENFDLQVLGCDPAMASQLMTNLERDRIPVVKYINRAAMVTAPLDDMMARAHAESGSQLLYDGDPVLEWAFSNVHGERKKDGTILPFKDSVDSPNKIDPVVAGAFAIGCKLHPEFAAKTKKPSVYEKRGLRGAHDGRQQQST